MPRGLTDQMEPMPPQVQELRAALAVYRRAAEEWKARAEKAEAEVVRLREYLREIADAPMSSKEDLVQHANRALAHKGGGYE